MKPRALLILLILVLGLGAFIYFYERELPSTGERQEQGKKVLSLASEEVEAVELRGEGRQVRFERIPRPPAKETAAAEGGPASTTAGWSMTVDGKSRRADASAVDDLVRRLTDLRKERTFDSYDPQQSGLATPRYEATLFAGGKSFPIAFGASLPLGDGLLIGHGGKAYQVTAPADFLALIGRQPGEWRDKRLFHDGRGQIRQVTLRAGEGVSTVLARRGENETFWLETLPADLADRDLVSGLLTDISSLEASSFVADGTPFPSSTRGIDVQVDGREQPWRIELGAARDGQAIALVDGQLVEIAVGRWEEALARQPSAWRSTFWSPLQVFAIDHAVFTRQGQTTEVHRIDGEWRRGAENQDKIDFAAASDALYPIVEMKAQEVLSRAEAAARGFDLATPRLEIALRTAGAEEKLQVFAAREGLAPATTSNREVVLLLPADKVAALEEKVETLRTAPVQTLPPPSPATASPTPEDEEELEG
jgi:hypothetical protein